MGIWGCSTCILDSDLKMSSASPENATCVQTGIVFRRNLSKDPQQKLALNAKGADEFMKLVHVPAALAGSQDTAAVTKPSSQPSSFLLKGGEEAGLVKLVGEVPRCCCVHAVVHSRRGVQVFINIEWFTHI